MGPRIKPTKAKTNFAHVSSMALGDGIKDKRNEDITKTQRKISRAQN
jgi:hypothetical protein